MAETDFMELAAAAVALERAARNETEIVDRATQLQHQAEREKQLAGLRQRHGLTADAPHREIADHVIAHQKAWGSFVACRFSGGAKTGHVMDPENSGHTDRAKIDELLALRARLKQQFDEQYAREAASRLAQRQRAQAA
jgi:N-formylglutamate amidohydrolase